MKKTLVYAGKKIVYQDRGSGYPVVLVHGFGEEANIWDEIAAALEKQYRLIIPDIPGSGESELTEDMSIEGMAATLFTLLHAEEIAHCCMIGHSMGGYITLAVAENYGNLLDGFGLFHSTAYADTAEKKAVRQKGIDFILEHGAFAFLKTATPNLFAPLTREKNPALIEKQITGLQRFTDAALINYYEAMIRRPDRTGVLKNARIPVLFIIGEYDQAVSPADSLAQSYLPDLSYIHLLKHAGHMGMLEETTECIRILESFLQDTVKQ